MTEKDEKYDLKDISYQYVLAAINNNIKLCRQILSKLPTRSLIRDDIDYIFISVCKKGYFEIIKHIIESFNINIELL